MALAGGTPDSVESLLDLYLLAWKATGEIDPEFDTLRYIDGFARTTLRPTVTELMISKTSAPPTDT